MLARAVVDLTIMPSGCCAPPASPPGGERRGLLLGRGLLARGAHNCVYSALAVLPFARRHGGAKLIPTSTALLALAPAG